MIRALPAIVMMMFTLAMSPTVHAGELQDALLLYDGLDDEMLTVSFADRRLEEVMTDLDRMLPIPVHADWPALDAIGIDRRDRVTLSMNGRATHILNSLAISLGDNFDKPVFETYEGRIVLTSYDALTRMLYTDVYDVRDLLNDAELVSQLRGDPATTAEPESQADNLVEPNDDQAAEGDDNRDEDSADDDQASPRPRRISRGMELMMLIADHVDPDAWVNYAGDRALLSERNGRVVVSAPASLHRKFRDALRQLRLTSPTDLHINASIVDVSRDDWQRYQRRVQSSPAGAAADLINQTTSPAMWTADTQVAFDESVDISAREAGIDIKFSVLPRFDKHTGRAAVKVNADFSRGDDHRSVRTTVTAQPQGDVLVLELAPATPDVNDTVRLLVLQVDAR